MDKPVAARCRYTSVKASRRELARINLGIFPSDIDAIITNAAGCGSGMHEYGLLFAGQMDAERAAAFGQGQDITVFLDETGIVAPRFARAGSRGLS